MSNTLTIIGRNGEGKDHLSIALGARVQNDNQRSIFLKNKYYQANVALSIEDIEADFEPFLARQALIFIFDVSKSSALEDLMSLEAIFFNKLRSLIDQYEEEEKSVLLESIIVVANKISNSPESNGRVSVALQHARKLCAKYSFELVQLPLIKTEDFRSFEQNPLLFAQPQPLVLASSETVQNSSGDSDDDFTYVDEDEVRGVYRILESLECCQWVHAPLEDQTKSVDDSETKNITDKNAVEIGSQSLYAVPLITKNADGVKDKDDEYLLFQDDEDDMSILDICNGKYPSTEKTGGKISKPTREENEILQTEALMEKLANFRLNKSTDHASNRQSADALMMAILEMFPDDFDEDEDDVDNEHENDDVLKLFKDDIEDASED